MFFKAGIKRWQAEAEGTAGSCWSRGCGASLAVSPGQQLPAELCCRSKLRASPLGSLWEGAAVGQEQQILSLPPALQAVDSNLANTEVRGRFFSPWGSFPFSSLPTPVVLVISEGRSPGLLAQRDVHSFSFHPCSVCSVVRRTQYYFWQQNCGSQQPCVSFPPHAERCRVVMLGSQEAFLEAWLWREELPPCAERTGPHQMLYLHP